MKVKSTLLAAVAAALLVPAAAQAASISEDSGTLVYDGKDSAGLWMSVSKQEDWNDGKTYLHFSDSGADVSIDTALCHEGPAGGIDCDLNASRPVRIEGSSSKDTITISQGIDRIPDSMPVTINGNGGNDTLKDAWSAPGNRTLNGGAGNDELWGYDGNDTLDGGDGNDNLDGGAGDDRVLGGGGDDEVDGDGYDEMGSDYVDGGPGYDYVDGWEDPELLDKNPSVDITLDGAGNDGRPGESDNVVNVEDFEMYTVGRIVGTDAREKIIIYNPANSGPSTLIGNGGDDELAGQDFNDTVDGGAGNDQVEGGLGNDTVTGGPGQDIIYGDATSSRCTWFSCKIPFGNDVIDARDGEADSIDCGIGQDKATVDAIDTVANCETVIGADSNGGGPGGSNGGSSGGNNGGGPKVSLTLGKAKIAALAAKGYKVSVACSAACTAKGTMTADAATGRKLGTRKVATGSGKTAKAGTAKVTLKASKKVARKLRKLKSAKVTVKMTVKQAGTTQTISRKLTLKR